MAASGRCCPSFWTVALLLHTIFILRSERLDHGVWRLDGWTPFTWLALSRIASRQEHYLVRTVATVFLYLCFRKKYVYLSNTERRPDLLLRHLDWCNREQFEASGHRWKVQTESSCRPYKWCLTDKRPDGIQRRPNGCKGTELTVLNSTQSLLEAHNWSVDSE